MWRNTLVLEFQYEQRVHSWIKIFCTALNGRLHMNDITYSYVVSIRVSPLTIINTDSKFHFNSHRKSCIVFRFLRSLQKLNGSAGEEIFLLSILNRFYLPLLTVCTFTLERLTLVVFTSNCTWYLVVVFFFSMDSQNL